MRHSTVFSKVVLLMALGASIAAIPAQSATESGTLPPIPQRTDEGSVRVGGRLRTFLVDVPVQYNAQTPLPVVVVFHGGGGSATSTRKQTRMTDVAGARGIIVVYPNGTGRLQNRLLTWNTGSCCGYAQKNNVDEVAFVRAMLDSMQRAYRIDTTRIFATGLSNGGMMAHLMGCALSDRFKAIAPVSGELSVPCKPSRPVSVLIIHGTADKNLPYNGGPGERALERHDTKSVQFAVDAWTANDGCKKGSAVDSTAALVHATFAGCAKGARVQLYKIIGGPHAWPMGEKLGAGLDVPSSALDATSVILDFFLGKRNG